MFVTQVQGSVLIAELTCSEDGVIQVGHLSNINNNRKYMSSGVNLFCLFPQSQYRILVEIVNENDNRPKFLKETIQPFTISEVNMDD